MIEKGKKKGLEEEISQIIIDYENIDVLKIMEQIRNKIAQSPSRVQEQEEFKEGTFQSSPPVGEREEGVPGLKRKLKRILLKITRPFSPFIKLLVLPVHEEAMMALQHIHETNKRLDSLNERLYQELKRLSDSLEKVDRNLNDRLNLAFDDLAKTRECVKLLHNLSHNIVVELSKLKIEHENLKLKTRIMEKDFEFLNKKEKILEKHLFR